MHHVLMIGIVVHNWFSKANWKHKAILGIGVIDFFRQKCNFVLNIVLEEEVKTHLKF